MLTVATSGIYRKREKEVSLKSKNTFDELCAVISEYDPEFIFLPAYLVIKRVREKMANGAERESAIREVRGELKIKNSNRNNRILKVAEKILNSNNKI